MKLRIARATNDLKKISKMYMEGLGLKTLGSFENHDGFDGVIIGAPESPYHFEFTYEKDQSAPRSVSDENILVFYFSNSESYKATINKMFAAGFKSVASRNPYWNKHGQTFEDLDGYRLVLCNKDWLG